MPGPVVTDEGVENVGAPSRQADGGGDRPLSFVSFALVIGLGIWVAADRGQRRHVHDSAQSATVTLGGVQSSGALSGVSRHWRQAGPGRELVSRSDQRGITNGGEAEVFIVFANVSPEQGYKGITAFIVEKEFAGFSVGKKEDKLGIRASSTTELILEDVFVPAENVLGEDLEPAQAPRLAILLALGDGLARRKTLQHLETVGGDE